MLRPWHHTLTLDKTSHLSIHQQLTKHFLHLIQHGDWLAGSALPSTRDIAQQLGINRKTVARVYDELMAHGLIYTQPKRGTFVATQSPAMLTPLQDPSTPSMEHASQLNVSIEQLIQKTILQHTRRAALHLHKLQTQAFDQGGLHLLRQMLANQLTHERKLLASPEQILCSTWLALEHALFELLKQRGGIVLIDCAASPALQKRLQQYGIEILVLPEKSAQLPATILIDELEKYCINYPIKTLWLEANSKYYRQAQEVRELFEQRMHDYQVLLIEDIRTSSALATMQRPLTSNFAQEAILLGSLYGQYCDMFNLYYICATADFSCDLKHTIDIHHQQSLLLNMLAQAELIKRGDYKKLMHRLQQLQLGISG